MNPSEKKPDLIPRPWTNITKPNPFIVYDYEKAGWGNMAFQFWNFQRLANVHIRIGVDENKWLENCD